MLRLTLISLLCIAISGCCGFKLRGTYTIPDYLRTVYITPNDPYEPLQRAVRARLAKAKVCVVCEPTTGVPTLEIGKYNITEQALAWESKDTQIMRYKYTLEVQYKLITEDASYTRTITRSRELSRYNNQLLSNESEKQTVERELIEEAASELLRSIASGPPHTMPTDDVTADDNPC